MIARLVAIAALALAFIAMVAVLTGDRGSDDSSSDSAKQTTSTSQTTTGQSTTSGGSSERTEESVYVVESGDSLTAIAEQTGISVDELLELNPDVDPQSLVEGQKLKLKP